MKQFLSIALALALTAALFAGCSPNAADNGGSSPVPASGTVTADPLAGQPAPAEEAKYVFLFIGDGMSFPQVLDNDKGFFLMCEGGKIDWACHANDAASTIHDTLALADAVQVAIDFAKTHAGETLILVTGDHETGGLTIGFAGTDYDAYLSLLDSQKISFAKFDSDYVSGYKEKKTSFDAVLSDIEELFGLKADGSADDKLVLTDYELGLLKTAYEKSVNETDTGMAAQEEYVAYGTYEPLTVTITHILNNKSGVSFSSYSHTGLPVAMFADGVNAEQFNGYYDNTDIYTKLAEMLAVK